MTFVDDACCWSLLTSSRRESARATGVASAARVKIKITFKIGSSNKFLLLLLLDFNIRFVVVGLLWLWIADKMVIFLVENI